MQNPLPNHIAIIMDGNGRWAALHKKTRNQGHEAGSNALKKIVLAANKKGIKYLSLYAFSTENWTRPKAEVDSLLNLLSKALDNYKKDFSPHNIRFVTSGRREKLDARTIKRINNLAEETKNNTGLTLNICFNYGARQEITDAVNKLLAQGKTKVEDGELSSFMYRPDMPDPELVIRTSGEQRLSNFLLWQASYSELYFTDVLWPDFDEKELDKAIETYRARTRRFGGI